LLNLHELLCFRLGAATRKIHRYYNNRLSQYGITLAQSFILISLLDRDGLTMRQLAERLELDSSAITGLVDRLEKEQLVERQPVPEDRRALQIVLSPRGRELAEKIVPVIREFHDRLMAALSPEEHATLEAVLLKINRLVES
jgi:DNA-binding MarR family transcriptional regulator